MVYQMAMSAWLVVHWNEFLSADPHAADSNSAAPVWELLTQTLQPFFAFYFTRFFPRYARIPPTTVFTLYPFRDSSLATAMLIPPRWQ